MNSFNSVGNRNGSIWKEKLNRASYSNTWILWIMLIVTRGFVCISIESLENDNVSIMFLIAYLSPMIDVRWAWFSNKNGALLFIIDFLTVVISMIQIISEFSELTTKKHNNNNNEQYQLWWWFVRINANTFDWYFVQCTDSMLDRLTTRWTRHDNGIQIMDSEYSSISSWKTQK